MTQHTPGPWKLRRTLGKWEIDPAICQVYDNLARTDSANARLIAKAPEMYKWIKEIADGDHTCGLHAGDDICGAGKTCQEHEDDREYCYKCDARALLREIEEG